MDRHRVLHLHCISAGIHRKDSRAGGLRCAEDHPVALSIDGLKERDRMVFRTAQSASARIFSVYAGGYAMQVEDTVTIHANTVLAAAEVFSFHGATSC